jgi:hypothetical protein
MLMLRMGGVSAGQSSSYDHRKFRNDYTKGLSEISTDI